MVKQPSKQTAKLDSVIDNYRPELHRYLRSKLGNPDDIEDVAQESYLRLLRVEFPELIKRPKDYLFRIASNVVHDFYLKQNRQPGFVDYDDIVDTEHEKDTGSLEQELEKRADLRKLEAVIRNLPALQQAAFLLKKRDGLSHEEIAEKLDISVFTSRAYVSKALAHCRLMCEDI